MNVDTIQKSYGFDNSGAIYMSYQKLIEWCVGFESLQDMVMWKAFELNEGVEWEIEGYFGEFDKSYYII